MSRELPLRHYHHHNGSSYRIKSLASQVNVELGLFVFLWNAINSDLRLAKKGSECIEPINFHYTINICGGMYVYLLCMNVRTYLRIYVCTYARNMYVYVCTYVRMHVCTYVRMCTYICRYNGPWS